MTTEELNGLVRDVPDFPKRGVVFKDITPLLGDAKGFSRSIDMLIERVEPLAPQALVGIESRGFIFAAAMAARMHLPLQLVRKKGKLPYRTVGLEYALEYGTDHVEIHEDAIEDGMRYAVVDDVLATGGIAAATAELIEGQGGVVTCMAFLIELAFLGGLGRLGKRKVERVLSY